MRLGITVSYTLFQCHLRVFYVRRPASLLKVQAPGTGPKQVGQVLGRGSRIQTLTPFPRNFFFFTASFRNLCYLEDSRVRSKQVPLPTDALFTGGEERVCLALRRLGQEGLEVEERP